jgi:hypothetical protein
LSRSTSTNTCGTAARKELLTFCSSGRLRAASRNFWRFWLRKSTEPPLRSCTQSEKPPEVPRPGMAGGVNANAVASGTWARNLAFSVCTSSAAVPPFQVRSSQGSSETKKKPL